MSKILLIVLWVISILFSSSSAWAENVSTLLEEGIYAEETKGDLDEAMTIYQKIIDENVDSSANIAEAYYRMGTCYLKTGDDSKAIEMFKELLTDSRDHEEIASDAKNQLIKLNALDEEDRIIKPLEIGPVPWEAGEVCQYSLVTSTGIDAGKMFYSIKDTVSNGNDLWLLEYEVGTPIDKSQLYMSDRITKDTFIPVSGVIKLTSNGLNINSMAEYSDDHIDLDIRSQNTKDKKVIPVSSIVYDENQVHFLLRVLPLNKGYSASFNVFNMQAGGVFKNQIRVLDREKVTVPAGTFDCFYIELQAGPIKEKIWISVDKNRYFVKSEGQLTFSLEKVSHNAGEEPVQYRDDEFCVSMTAPAGWHFVKSSITPQCKMFLQVLPRELEFDKSILFLINDHGGTMTPETLRQDMEKEAVSALKSAYKKFTVKPESWETKTIGGLYSISFIGNYDVKDTSMVLYTTYIIDSSRLFCYAVTAPEESFAANKDEIDSVIRSFKKDEL